MVGLDTNVLARYIAQDDAKQALKATHLIESLTVENPGFISLVAVVELVWVLQGCYQASRSESAAVLERLLRIRTLVVENAEMVVQALREYQGTSADFADCLINRSGIHAGCSYTATFDRKASKAGGMQLIQ